jgi:hypothetical protein
MGFTQGAYTALVTKLEESPAKIVSLTNTIISNVNGSLGWIPLIGDAVKAALNKLKGLVEEVCAKLKQLLQGAAVPLSMWNAGGQWLGIQGSANKVAGAINGQMQANGNEWQGLAGGKYNTGVGEQGSAAGTMSTVAGGMQSNCSAVGNAGLAFYSAIAVGEGAIVGGLITCAAAGWTGVGAIVGLCVAIGGALLGFGAAVGAVQIGIDSATRGFTGLTDVGLPNNAWPLATAQ